MPDAAIALDAAALEAMEKALATDGESKRQDGDNDAAGAQVPPKKLKKTKLQRSAQGLNQAARKPSAGLMVMTGHKRTKQKRQNHEVEAKPGRKKDVLATRSSAETRKKGNGRGMSQDPWLVVFVLLLFACIAITCEALACLLLPVQEGLGRAFNPF